MSFSSDLKCTLSQKWLREKLTLKERANLLWDITTALDMDEYDKEDENGEYLGPDTKKAMAHLKQYDNDDSINDKFKAAKTK